MRWENSPESDHVEDRRGFKFTKGKAAAGGIGTIVIAFIASQFLGIDFNTALRGTSAIVNSTSSGQSRQVRHEIEQSPEEKKLAKFVSVILKDTERVWTKKFAERQLRYKPPTLVLFTDQVKSACGFQSSATGPFYCPPDQKAYIDLGFYQTLKNQLGAPGDFAQAYVLAHEIGHHVQNLLGTSDRVTNLQRRARSKADANALSVKLELQADCFAGVWAHYAQKDKNMLEPGDLEEGLNAASKIGDDTLQRNAGRSVAPDSFTHGSSQQRMKWLKIGQASGNIDDCDTFNAIP